MKTGEKKINPTTCHNLSLSPRSSWEPAENVVQCDRLLSSFWKHVGLDDRDYSPGDRFDAQPSWISAPMYAPLDRCFANHRRLTEREREFFANQWGKVKKKKRASRNKHYSFMVSCPAVFRYKSHRQ